MVEKSDLESIFMGPYPDFDIDLGSPELNEKGREAHENLVAIEAICRVERESLEEKGLYDPMMHGEKNYFIAAYVTCMEEIRLLTDDPRIIESELDLIILTTDTEKLDQIKTLRQLEQLILKDTVPLSRFDSHFNPAIDVGEHLSGYFVDFLQKIEFVIENDLTDVFLALNEATKEAYKALKKTSVKGDPTSVLNYLGNPAHHENKETIIGSLKKLKNSAGENYLKPFRRIILNSAPRSDNEAHFFQESMRSSINYFVDNCFPLRNSGYEKELYTLLDFMESLRVKALPNATLTFSESIIGLNKLSQKDFFYEYLRCVEPLTNISPDSDTSLADFRWLLRTVKKYYDSGLEDKLEGNLHKFMQIHIDNIEQSKERKGDYLVFPGLMFFENYPLYHDHLGEDITDKFHQELESIIKIDLANKRFNPLDNLDKSYTGLIPLNFVSQVEQKIKGNKPVKEIFSSPERFNYITNSIKKLTSGDYIADRYKFQIHYYLFKLFDGLFSAAERIDVDNLSVLEDFIDPINDYLMFPNLEKVIPLFKSELPKEEKNQILKHFSIVQNIPNIPEFTNEDKWYQGVADILKVGSVKETKEWFNNVFVNYFHSSNTINFISDKLPLVLENNMDLDKSLSTIPKIRVRGLGNYVLELRYLIESDLEPNEITKILVQLGEHRGLLSVLPLDTFDINDWLGRAQEKSKTYIKDQFESNHEYSQKINLRIANACKSPKIRNLLTQILELESQDDHNLAFLTPGQEYGHRRITQVKKKVDLATATKCLIYGLISRKEEKIKLAEEVFDSETLKASRDYIASSNCPPHKLYQKISTDLERLEKMGNTDLSIQLGQISHKITNLIKETYLSGTGYNSDKHQLRNLVRSLETCQDEERKEFVKTIMTNGGMKPPSSFSESFDEIVCQVQDYTLNDLFDGRRLFACTFLSEDKEDVEVQGILYHADPFIALQHIVPYQEGKKSGQPIGVSILAHCHTDDNTSVMLIDSAEGGELLRKVPEDLYLSLFMEGLVGASEDSNSELVFVPQIAINSVAKKFRNYFIKFVGGMEPRELYLTKMRGNGKIEIPPSSRLLEAFNDRERLSEVVKGYFLPTTQLREIYDMKARQF